MAFALPLVQVGNVNIALRDLKEKGFWVYGLTADGDTSLPNEQFTKPSVFVLGNEGRGIREKTEELCDFKLSIPIAPDCESLNASASAAVVLYAWRSQRPV
jgi:23S rRNA (guanosine2251-2'-O)-methyltransferase